jgi:hypothetical protein
LRQVSLRVRKQKSAWDRYKTPHLSPLGNAVRDLLYP